MATADVACGEPFLEVPLRLMICPPTILADPVAGEALERCEETVYGDSAIAAFLMLQRRLGAASFWAPYVASLPEPRVLCDWSAQAVEALHDPRLADRAGMRLARQKSIYTRVFEKCLCVREPELFGSGWATFAEFRWAWEVVQSRAFGKRLPWAALVPFADSLNHANVPTKYALDPAGAEDERTFKLFSTAPGGTPLGAEAFNSYGRRPNDNLLLDYGFALADNEWDTVDWPAELDPNESAALRLQKRALLRGPRLSLPKIRLRRAEGLSLEAVRFCRVLALTGDDMRAIERAPPQLAAVGAVPVHAANERAALRAMRGRLADMEAQWPTPLVADEAALAAAEAAGAGDRDAFEALCALRYRVSRKGIVCAQRRAVEVAEEALEALLAGQAVGSGIGLDDEQGGPGMLGYVLGVGEWCAGSSRGASPGLAPG